MAIPKFFEATVVFITEAYSARNLKVQEHELPMVDSKRHGKLERSNAKEESGKISREKW